MTLGCYGSPSFACLLSSSSTISPLLALCFPSSRLPSSLPCHSTLLNCPSNGKDGSVEMERIEKRRGGNQWDNRQGRGPEQRGWPLHWSVETTHTLLLQYVQSTQSQASAHARHSGVTQRRVQGCWVVVRRCRGYGDKLRCPVTSIWGGLGLVCRVPLEVICCRISDGLEMGLEREFMPPITEKKKRITPNARRAPNNWQGRLTVCCTAANTHPPPSAIMFCVPDCMP